MESRRADREARQSTDSLDAQRSEARAIVFLLASLEQSLKTFPNGNGCIGVVQNCIARIASRFQLSNSEIDEAIVWSEASIDGMQRFLNYARWEIRERLRDMQSFEELGACIEYLNGRASQPQ